MRQDKGASADADRATHEQSPQAVSAVPVGIPSAEARILAILIGALEPMQTQGMGWPSFYRWMKRKPDEIIARLRDSGVLFRLAEQAHWPVVAEAYHADPTGLRQTIRLQVTIGGQTFGTMQTACFAQYAREPGFVQHVAGEMVRTVIAHAAKPFEEAAQHEVARAIAQGIDTRRAETEGLGAQHESPVAEGHAP